MREGITKKPQWLNYAQSLQEKSSREIIRGVITDTPSVPMVITGTILEKLGIASLVSGLPLVGVNKRLSEVSPDPLVPFFGSDIQNPELLRHLIRESDPVQPLKAALSRLIPALEIYRHYPENVWYKAAGLLELRLGQEIAALHKLVALQLLGYSFNPGMAYINSQEVILKYLHSFAPSPRLELEKSLAEGLPIFPESVDDVEDNSDTTIYRVPVLKSVNSDPDKIEVANFALNRKRIRSLKGEHLSIATGGSPNSGKSTIIPSLVLAMKETIKACVSDGIIKEGEITANWCNLDPVFPTIDYIASGLSMEGKKKSPVTIETVQERVEAFKEEIARSTITIGDLPGGDKGIPNMFVFMLASRAKYSILVDRHYQEELKPWKNFFGGLLLPPTLAYIHTRLEEGRSSGLRFYGPSHRITGKFLHGRVANADRTLMPEDKLLIFLSKALLFDLLPDSILRVQNHRKNLVSFIKA